MSRLKIFKNVTELIGNTPLLALEQMMSKHETLGQIIGKVESFNPAGSVKDRIALAMIDEAENSGALTPKTVIVEPTSGNTGVGLAAIAAAKGYEIILTMPETMSIERRNLMKAFGAKIVLTEAAKGMKGAIAKAEEIAAGFEKAFIPGQFTNPANPAIHFNTTGPEIWDAAGKKVDVLVSGIGTGGTITGVGKFLKEKNPNVHVVAVEPTDSPVLSKNTPGVHKIQGTGAGFIPEILDQAIYDEIITVSNEDAFNTGKELAQVEGILAGISSGAAVWAALQVAKRDEFAGKNIIVILPDTGERYLSTAMFNDPISQS